MEPAHGAMERAPRSVVLVNSMTTMGDHDEYSIDFAEAKLSESLSVGYLQAFLEAKLSGVRVETYNPILKQLSAQVLATQVHEARPLLVGISVVTQWQRNFALTLAAAIKSELPDTHVVIGGIFPTSDWAGMLLKGNGAVDSICRGEGETTLLELVQALQDGRDWRSLQGLAYVVDGLPVTNPLRANHSDLGELPFPNRAQLGVSLERGGVIQVEASRGCNASCVFCDMRHTNWRPRPVEHLLDEVEELTTLHPDRSLWFIDNMFIGFGPGRFERVEHFSREVKRRDLKLRFSFQDRAENVTMDAIGQLKSAGLNSLYIGIESFAGSALKRWAKGSSVQTNLDALSVVGRSGVFCHVGLIVFDDAVNMSEIRSNVSAMAVLAQANPYVHLHNLNELIPYSGTFLEKLYIQKYNRPPEQDSKNVWGISSVPVQKFRDWSWAYLQSIWPITQLVFALIDDARVQSSLLALIPVKNQMLANYLLALLQAIDSADADDQLEALLATSVAATSSAVHDSLAGSSERWFSSMIEEAIDTVRSAHSRSPSAHA
jgi:radical SAM superfamily enzyme YgiQ (UPF0313 family)